MELVVLVELRLPYEQGLLTEQQVVDFHKDKYHDFPVAKENIKNGIEMLFGENTVNVISINSREE
jgi:hypothetical protein